MLGALSPIKLAGPEDMAYAGTGTSMVPVDSDSQGNDLQPSTMGPMDSMMAIFEEIRDGINQLVELAYTGPRAEQPTADEMVADADADALLEPDSQGNDPSDTGTGGFEFPSIPKPGPKLGLALLLGGLATLMAFGDKMVPYIAPVLKFIKEKALPFAIDAFKAVFSGIKSVFDYAYENIWPFIKDNIIMNAIDYVKETFQGIKDLFNDLGERFGTLFSEDATWWERITAFIGIFTDIGQFFLDQFDRFTEFVANIFGVSFAPYDGLLSFIKGKLSEGFKVVVTWFSETGEFLLEGAKGIWGWITGKIDTAWTGITTWFSETGTFLADGAKGIWEWITTKIDAVWTGITTWFSETGTFLADGAKGIWEWVTTKVGAVWTGITEWFSTTGSFLADGATGLWEWVTGKIDGAWQVITSWFGFGSEEESGEPPFSITGWIGEQVSKLWNKITGFFKFGDEESGVFNMPNIGDAFMNMIGKLLPSPDKWIGRALYSLPGTGALKKAAEMYAAGGSIQGGQMVMPETAEETLASGSGVEKSALEQIKRNQRNMEIYSTMGSEDDVLRDGHTIESKLFELEMQNAQLASQLSGAELKKLQEFQERQGYAQGGGIAVNTFNTDNSQNDNSNTNQSGDYNVEGSDSTAKALGYSGYSDTGDID